MAASGFSAGLLAGLRIVEVSAFVAAPLAGATLAGLGADVIRVEQIGGGIDARRWPLHGGRSLYRRGLDRGKRSVALDLRGTAGRELAARLATAPGDGAGIVVTNLGARGWLEFDRLRERRPDLVMVAISGTPDGRAAVDYTVNAGAGFPWVTGPPGTHGPVNHVLPAWDVAAGMLTALAVVAAERARSRDGQGRLVEIALSDVALAVAGHLGYLEEALAVEEPRGRFGNDLYGSYARDFTTRDGRRVMVCALTPRQWDALVEVTGIGAAAGEIERRHGVSLRDEGARFVHREEVHPLVEAWVAARDFEQVAAGFEAGGVLWGPYRTFREWVAEDPRAAAPPASPIRPAGEAERPAPQSPAAIGDSTASVLGEVLGLDAAEIAELRTAGIIGEEVT